MLTSRSTAAFREEIESADRVYSIPDLHAATRAWRQAALPGTDRFASTLRGRLLAFHAENRGAGSALDFGLAAGALVDAGCSVQVARNVLEELFSPALRSSNLGLTNPMRGYQVGSQVASVAIAASALARLAARISGTLP